MCIAAEPPPAAAQKGVQLWEGGPFWADRNVGADEPWAPGLYFWWGDPVGYKRENDAWVASDGSGSDPTFRDGGNAPYARHASKLMQDGWTTTNNVLAPAHDSATAHWGGEWRMPTRQELDDLCYNKCDWTWTDTDGAKGFVVRGRGDYASATIFIPASGYGAGSAWNDRSMGFLWSSSAFLDGPPTDCSWRLAFTQRLIGTDYCWDRWVAVPIRPVMDGGE